jgi:hypothetical protein
MPQVDKVSFFPQVFWLIFLLILFYIFFLRYTFTNISNIFKTRNYFFLENSRSTHKNKINLKTLTIKNIFINTIFIEQLILNNKTEIINTFQNWLNISAKKMLLESEIFKEIGEAKVEQVLTEQALNTSEN